MTFTDGITEMISSSIEKELISRGEIIYTNCGDSMYPLIRPIGDVLVIKRKTHGFKKYDVALYKRDDGKYILHRIIKVNKDGTYVACGDNRYSKEFGLTDANMLGVLVSVVRNGKETKQSDLKCRIYAHLWCDFFYLRKIILIAVKMFKRRVK